MWRVVAGEIMGQCAGSELCRRAVGFGSIAFVAGEARGSGAVDVFAAIQDLGQVAIN